MVNKDFQSAAFSDGTLRYGTLRLIDRQLTVCAHGAGLASYCQLPVTSKQIVTRERRRDLPTFQVNFTPT